MCEIEGHSVSKFIPPVSLMWPRDACLNQRSFCFYAEMWALDSAQLFSIAFVLVPTSLLLLFFFAFKKNLYPLFLLLPHSSLFQYSVCLYPPLLYFLPMLFCLPLLSSFFFLLIFLSPLVISIHAFFFSHISQFNILPPLCPCVFSPPVHSSSYRPLLSVPAGGRGPLGAATAAQGQLLAGGDEAG